jgi:hypothetical protein
MRASFSVWVSSVVATANGDGQSQSHVGILPATCKLMPTAFESIKGKRLFGSECSIRRQLGNKKQPIESKPRF